MLLFKIPNSWNLESRRYDAKIKYIKYTFQKKYRDDESIEWGKITDGGILDGGIEENIEEGDSMSQETYAKNEIDLKFENLSDKVDSKFELLSQKIDSGFSNQSLEMNNSLLDFKQALKDEA